MVLVLQFSFEDDGKTFYDMIAIIVNQSSANNKILLS